MKNIQIIDGADNTTFSLFQAKEAEFAAIFLDESEMTLIEDVIQLLGGEETSHVLGPIWDRPILKRDAVGIHGTLFYDSEHRREHLPASGREVDWEASSVSRHRELCSPDIRDDHRTRRASDFAFLFRTSR